MRAEEGLKRERKLFRPEMGGERRRPRAARSERGPGTAGGLAGEERRMGQGRQGGQPDDTLPRRTAGRDRLRKAPREMRASG